MKPRRVRHDWTHTQKQERKFCSISSQFKEKLKGCDGGTQKRHKEYFWGCAVFCLDLYGDYKGMFTWWKLFNPTDTLTKTCVHAYTHICINMKKKATSLTFHHEWEFFLEDHLSNQVKNSIVEPLLIFELLCTWKY